MILGVGLVGLTQGLTTALGSSKESEIQTTAALIAAGRIETLRAEPYLTDGVKEGECGEGLSLYRWKLTIAAAQPEGLHEVQVEVENSKSGKPIYELRTLLFDPPSTSTLEDRGSRKEPAKSTKRDGRKR